MAKQRNSDRSVSVPAGKYRQVKVAGLRWGRRGKHYDLVEGIMKEILTLPSGSALEIPLDDEYSVGLPNLRSAIHRAASSADLKIETVSREGKFYVWRQSSTRVQTAQP